MNLRDCQRILQVPPGAGLDEVKAAFRRLAFTLHPDLNPSPNAADKFRELNEAYILLSRTLKDEQAMGGRRADAAGGQTPPPGSAADEKARKAKAGRAYAKSQSEAKSSGWTFSREGGAQPPPGEAKKAGFHLREEEVLRDLLSDPFARQVFEDIYSQLKQTGRQEQNKGPFGHPLHKHASPHPHDPAPQGLKRRRLEISWGDKTLGLDLGKGLVGGVKSWMRSQLDDEQTVHYPAHALGPGRALRLTVSTRFGDSKTIEITLPQDFVVGRPVRLRGLGRKLGPFTGDLYLRVLAK